MGSTFMFSMKMTPVHLPQIVQAREYDLGSSLDKLSPKFSQVAISNQSVLQFFQDEVFETIQARDEDLSVDFRDFFAPDKEENM